MNLLFLSDIYHTLKQNFSRHVYEAVLQTEHLLSVTAEDSFLIATVGLLPKLNLTGDSFIDFPFHIIKVQHNTSLVDEPAKPVGATAVRIMKMIPDKIGGVRLALLDQCIGIEVCDCHDVGVKFHSGIDFFFRVLYAVCSLLYLLIPSTSLNGLNHFKYELCADLEALAELIAVGKIVQINICRLIFLKQFLTIGAPLFE